MRTGSRVSLFLGGFVIVVVTIAALIFQAPVQNEASPPVPADFPKDELPAIAPFPGNTLLIEPWLQGVSRDLNGYTDLTQEMQVSGTLLYNSQGESWITGTLENKVNQDYTNVLVFFDLYDRNGASMGSAYASFSTINRKTKQPFITYPVNCTAYDYRMKYILSE